jgi:hypothetical protein
MLALLLLGFSSVWAAERVPTQELVQRCSHPVRASAADYAFSGMTEGEARAALLMKRDDLQIDGAVVAPVGKQLWVGFEGYRKDLQDQRYAVVGVLQRVKKQVRVLMSTRSMVDLGFRHHLLGFYPVLKTGGPLPVPLRVCRAWLGDPEHFYRESLFLLVPGPHGDLSVGLRTLMTESEKFGDSHDSVNLRQASLAPLRPWKKDLTKKLAGSNEAVHFVWRSGHYEYESAKSRDPLLPTPTDGP